MVLYLHNISVTSYSWHIFFPQTKQKQTIENWTDEQIFKITLLISNGYDCNTLPPWVRSKVLIKTIKLITNELIKHQTINRSKAVFEDV